MGYHTMGAGAGGCGSPGAFTSTYIYICMYIYIYMDFYLHVCMCIYVFVKIYIHVCIWKQMGGQLVRQTDRPMLSNGSSTKAGPRPHAAQVDPWPLVRVQGTVPRAS